jgi:competence protein ComEC
MPAAWEPAWDERAPPAWRPALPFAWARWIKRNFIAERARWGLWLPAFMGAGIGIYFWLTAEPPLWAGVIALAVASAIAILCAIRPRWSGALPAALAIVALALGFALMEARTWMVAAPVLQHRLGPVAVEGRLVSIDPLPEGTRIVIAPSHIDRLAPNETPKRVRIRLRSDAGGLVPGEWLSVRSLLMPPPAPAMPGAYDFERRAYFDRLGAVGFAFGAPKTMPPPDGAGPSGWQATVQAVRSDVTARILAALPGRDGAIAAAIVTGATHAIRPEDADAFRDAGLAHILVIAGLHMGMVAGIVFFAMRALLALIPAFALRYSTKKAAALTALATTFCYLLLSDATVSSRRAFIMVALMLFGVMLDRVTLSARTLAYAAIAIMALSPESAAGPSFQLSFAAVAGLVACYEALRPRLAAWHAHAARPRRVALYLFGIALTTIVTTLATMPFTIFHFNRFPLYSIAANILAVPITGFWIMPWAILSCLAMPFGLEALPLQPMGWGIEAVARIAHGVTALPDAVLHVPSMPNFGVALLAFGGLWLCIWTRAWRFLGLIPIAAGYATILLAVPPDILVAGDGGLIAVRSAAGDYLPSRSHGSNWTEEMWIQRAAAELGPAWPRRGESADGRLACDAGSCTYRVNDRTVAIVGKRADVARACAGTDLVISAVAAHYNCDSGKLIDSVDVWKLGGHAIWLTPGGVEIESVAAWRGTRPWTRAPMPRRLSTSASDRPASLEP